MLFIKYNSPAPNDLPEQIVDTVLRENQKLGGKQKQVYKRLIPAQVALSQQRFCYIMLPEAASNPTGYNQVLFAARPPNTFTGA